MLCEGVSIRAITRMTGVSKNTVTKLLIDAGTVFADYQDKAFRNLPCKRLQVDEIWSFVGCKGKNAPKKQTDIHNVLKDTFNELLQHDSKARTEIKGLLREIEKEDWTHFIKKVGIGGWTLLIAIISAVVGVIARGYVNK